MPAHANATREQIIAALKAGHSIYRINRELRVDKARVRTIRNELDMPTYVRPAQTRTIEDKWREYTKPAGGGHMEWTGERGFTSRTPMLSFKAKHYSAAAIAFRMRTGRDPEGFVLADCGRKHCVAPDHVEDETGRQRNREQLRYLQGGRKRPERCTNGHEQSEHGRLTTDGRQYCDTCKRGRDRVAGQAVAS